MLSQSNRAPHQNFRASLRTFFCLAVIASAAHAQTNDARKISISGRVTGATGNHAVYVALWESRDFLKHPVQQIRIEPNADPSFHFQTAPGRWVLSAFEDKNENGILDMGMFGPKEPSGFWPAFHGWHKPRFEELATQIDHDMNDAVIRLK